MASNDVVDVCESWFFDLPLARCSLSPMWLTSDSETWIFETCLFLEYLIREWKPGLFFTRKTNVSSFWVAACRLPQRWIQHSFRRRRQQQCCIEPTIDRRPIHVICPIDHGAKTTAKAVDFVEIHRRSSHSGDLFLEYRSYHSLWRTASQYRTIQTFL